MSSQYMEQFINGLHHSVELQNSFEPIPHYQMHQECDMTQEAASVFLPGIHDLLPSSVASPQSYIRENVNSYAVTSPSDKVVERPMLQQESTSMVLESMLLPYRDFTVSPSVDGHLESMDYPTNGWDFKQPMELQQKKMVKKAANWRPCLTEGCTRRAQSMNKCKTHGGGKRCQFEGCGKASQGGGFCRTHGGGKRCKIQGCLKGTQRAGLCYQHGGIRHCKKENCTKKDRGNGFCIAHGGGRRCGVANCDKSVRKGNRCRMHLQQDLSYSYLVVA